MSNGASTTPLTDFYECLYEDADELRKFIEDPWAYIYGEVDNQGVVIRQRGRCTSLLQGKKNLEKMVMRMNAAQIRKELEKESGDPNATFVAYVLLK